jgi:hypothetical protein
MPKRVPDNAIPSRSVPAHSPRIAGSDVIIARAPLVVAHGTRGFDVGGDARIAYHLTLVSVHG